MKTAQFLPTATPIQNGCLLCCSCCCCYLCRSVWSFRDASMNNKSFLPHRYKKVITQCLIMDLFFIFHKILSSHSKLTLFVAQHMQWSSTSVRFLSFFHCLSHIGWISLLITSCVKLSALITVWTYTLFCAIVCIWCNYMQYYGWNLKFISSIDIYKKYNIYIYGYKWNLKSDILRSHWLAEKKTLSRKRRSFPSFATFWLSERKKCSPPLHSRRRGSNIRSFFGFCFF